MNARADNVSSRVAARRARFREAVARLSDRARSTELLRMLLLPGRVSRCVARLHVHVLRLVRRGPHAARDRAGARTSSPAGSSDSGWCSSARSLLAWRSGWRCCSGSRRTRSERAEKRLKELEERAALEALMRIAYTPEQEDLRRELREYFAQADDPGAPRSRSTRGEGDYGDGVAYRETVRQLGKDGWLGIGWPKEYGGQARSMIEQLIFMDEAAIANAPVPLLTLNSVGPTIMQYGTEEQKQRFLAPILAGRDPLRDRLLRARSRHRPRVAEDARRPVGDEYVINGQKMWTSLVEYADYVWLAVRTDPDVKKHKGLSVLIVPTDARGVPLHAGAHGGRRDDQRDVLRGRPRAGRQPRGRGERRLAADHQPAEPRARRAHFRRRG